jgi:hypothetical protein
MDKFSPKKEALLQQLIKKDTVVEDRAKAKKKAVLQQLTKTQKAPPMLSFITSRLAN